MKQKIQSDKLTSPSCALIIALLMSACSEQKPAKILTAEDYPESGSAQTALYLEKCGSCHAAPLPNIHNENQWFGVVQRMQFRMTNKAIKPLNKEELEIVISYLQKHARKK